MVNLLQKGWSSTIQLLGHEMVLIMPSEEIRVPTQAWSNSYLEQNRFLIDIGLHLILLALAISPFVLLYAKKKSPAGWLDLALLTGALLGLPFASSYAVSVLPEHQTVFVRGYEVLCLAVLVISIVMVAWKIKRLTRGAYAIRVLGTLLLLGLVITLLLPTVPSAREAAKRMACSSNLKSLSVGLIEANKKTLNLDNPPPLNDPKTIGGPDVSWRVKVLPFISLDSVYQKYDLSSSWNSDANWPLACQKIDQFSCPSEPDLKNPKGGRFTSYVMLENTNKNSSNPNLLYDQNRKLLDAHRILLIESSGANVLWTEPRDADVDTLRWSFKPTNRQEENEPWRSKNVGSSGHSGIVQIAFGDGSVRCIPKKIDDDVLKKLLLKGLQSDEDLDQ